MAANFYGRECQWKDAPDVAGYKCVIGNYKDVKTTEGTVWTLRPYEAVVWYK